MDGDVIGPSQWQPIINAISPHGRFAKKYLFAASCSAKWQAQLSSLGIDLMIVPRRAGGKKGPNDIAIAMEAARSIAKEGPTTFALAVLDIDFVYLAERLRSWGHSVLLVSPDGVLSDVPAAFEAVGARTVVYRFIPTDGSTGDAKFKAVLGPNGESTEMKATSEERSPLLDTGALKAAMHSLNFIQDIEDKYGTASCRGICRGGGPFILKASQEFVPQVLTRLGYLDKDLNADTNEAIEVFCESGHNKRSLQLLGIDLRPSYVVEAKVLMLSSALLSSKSYGRWTVGPSDTEVRMKLKADRRMSSSEAPPHEVFQAMGSWAQQNELAVKRTYNGRVLEYSKFVHRDDPHLRQ